MITLTPVLDLWSIECPFWPVGESRPIVRRPTAEQVGTAIWALIGRSVTSIDLHVTAGSPADAIEAYLILHRDGDDDDHAPGGLRLTRGGVVIEPGCCAGLDEWRDWLRVPGGAIIDLGHDPDVLIEHRGPVVRVWQDRDRLLPGDEPGPGEPYADVPRTALPGLLHGVQQDLIGFLDAVRPWARRIAPDLAGPLAEAVDRRLRITAPLEIAPGLP
ncbi:hypothetical protein [Actinoplanes utahensis]|uniref:hypothetical protein n=1 Tax=Actinoplanes utahensis TaxID=1869 RepID=UPI00126A4ACD|nr:hypothetical protein [Actinoplanes utahensis]